MKAVLIALVLAVGACAGPSPVATISPSPAVSPPASIDSSPSPMATPSATPSLEVNVAPAGLSLSCRLPVSWPVQNGQTTTYAAGFITLPGGAVSVDPSAPTNSVFYDRALSKWLPVWRTSVSPDGKRYAYGEGNGYQNSGGKLHVVDIATGADRIIYSGGTVYAVLDFAADGLYLTAAAPEGRPRGLWWQDPTGGPARLISSSIAGPAVGGGAGWCLDFNAADPSPGPGGLEGPVNRVSRFDLRTGASAPWFYRPGSDLYLMGVDAGGHPIVRAYFETSPTGQGTYEIWVVTGPTSATEIYSGSGVGVPARLAANDSFGAWLDGGEGRTVWLYAGGSLQAVLTSNVSGLLVAGGCFPNTP